VSETAHYVHNELAFRLPAVTAGYYLRVFAFYVQFLIIPGVSHPRSNVARELRISQRLLGVV